MSAKPRRPGNLLDRAIAPVAPGWALSRLKARSRLVAAQGIFGGGYGAVELAAASRKGRLGNWLTRKLGRLAQGQQRREANLRAEDLVTNDPTAAGAISTMTVGTVGSGLKPQSRPKAELLGVGPEAAALVGRQAEFWWNVWRREADLAGRLSFDDIQFLNLYWMLARGEYLCTACMSNGPGRAFGLALQVLDPDRLQTPPGLTGRDDIIDGVELDAVGGPIAYHIADVGRGWPSLTEWRRIPLKTAHRWNCLHGFFCRRPEQLRGVSLLAPMVKHLRHLDDYLDYELIGAIMAAAFSVFIEDDRQVLGGAVGIAPGGQPMAGVGRQSADDRHLEVEPGLFFYGGPGQKPHILESKRPSSAAETFFKVILRTIANATGIPYVALLKDYEATSFSSARAALNEAYRVYQMYRHWLVDHFCQHLWEMFFEEAVLRGYIAIPGGLEAFYAAAPAWTACDWIGPPRLQVDPKKEMEAHQIALGQKITTRARVIAETTGADWEDEAAQMAREDDYLRSLGLVAAASAAPPQDQPDDDEEPKNA